MLLIIVRGNTGSGKTSFAKLLSKNCISPKMYNDLAVSTKWCINECERLMQHGKKIIVVEDNFLRLKEIEPYLQLATKYQYKSTIIRCEGNYYKMKETALAEQEIYELYGEVKIKYNKKRLYKYSQSKN